MDTPHKLLSVVAGSLVSLGTIYTVVTFTHDKIQELDVLHKDVATCMDDIKLVRSNVIIDELKTDIFHLQAHIFRVEDAYHEQMSAAPSLIREVYKTERAELESLQQELKVAQRAYKALR